MWMRSPRSRTNSMKCRASASYLVSVCAFTLPSSNGVQKGCKGPGPGRSASPILRPFFQSWDPGSHGPGRAEPRDGRSAILRSVATHLNSAVIACASVSAASRLHCRRIPRFDERPIRIAHMAAAESLCTTNLQRRVRRERAAQRIARTSAPASFSFMCACRTRDVAGYA